MIDDFRLEFERYRTIADKAIAQVSDEALNRVPAPDGNSIAMIMRHLGGNLRSRFTDFLVSDGEKPWRERDREFDEGPFSRAEVEQSWNSGWQTLESALDGLGAADLTRTVSIRGVPLTVAQALCRSLAHLAYHVGQIVLLARQSADGPWRWISIPKGGSAAYNRNPTRERRP